jgi:hypothetical protein
MKQTITVICIILLFSLLQSSYSQETWEQLPFPEDTHIWDIKFHPDGTIFVGTFSSKDKKGAPGIYRSNDNGYTWEYLLSNYGTRGIDIDENGRIYVIGSGYYGKKALAYSDDKGDSWVGVSPPALWSSQEIKVYSTDSILISNWETTGSILYLYSPSADTWDTLYQNNHYDEYISDIEIFDKTIFISFMCYYPDQGGVAKSTDYGATWEFCGLLNHQINSIEVDNNGNLYAGDWGYTNNSGIHRLGHQDTIFQNVYGTVEIQDIASNANNDIFSTSIGGIVYSDNNGLSFKRYGSGYNHTMYAIEIDSNGYLYAGWDSTLLRSINSTIVGDNTLMSNVQEPVIFYPSPSINNIICKVPKPDNLKSIQIYNASGDLVWQKYNDFQKNFCIKNLSPGLYVAVSSYDSKTSTSKFVIL